MCPIERRGRFQFCSFLVFFCLQKDKKNKLVTGYILYSREVRKRVVQNHPESNFGEISKIVGNEWRSLSAGEKQAWEEKASKINEDMKAQLLLEEQQCPSPSPALPNPDQVNSNKKESITKNLLKRCFVIDL